MQLQPPPRLRISKQRRRSVIQHQRRLKIRPGNAVLNPRNLIPQIQPFGLRLRRIQQPPHAPPQISRPCQVRLILSSRSTERKHPRQRRYGAKNRLRLLRRKVNNMIELKGNRHTRIVASSPPTSSPGPLSVVICRCISCLSSPKGLCCCICRGLFGVVHSDPERSRRGRIPVFRPQRHNP